MFRVDLEERFARCYKCAAGLSYLENLFFGNRCLFCADKTQNVKLRPFLRMAKVDWKIYQALIILKERRGSEEGRLQFLGILSVLGYQDFNDVYSITIKKEILKELRKLCK